MSSDLDDLPIATEVQRNLPADEPIFSSPEQAAYEYQRQLNIEEKVKHPAYEAAEV